MLHTVEADLGRAPPAARIFLGAELKAQWTRAQCPRFGNVDTIGGGVILVAELDRIADARLEDGKALLAGGRYDGAAYVCGYAVEVALKARICRTLNWSDFPSTKGEFQAYRTFQTHDLDVLLRLSGQEARIKHDLFDLWNAVAMWNPESRYSVIGTIQRADAESMNNAAEQLLKAL